MERTKLKLKVPGASCALALAALLIASPLLAEPVDAADPAEEGAAQQVEATAAAEEAAEEQAGEAAEEEAEEPQQSEDIEEIVVTGSKQEGLQEIPVAVTIFSATDIKELRIQDISDLSDYTPNLEINTAFAASNPTIFIRGIGLKDYNANAAGAVAVFQDGIYINSPAGQLFQLFDVESVQVLRGPQGSSNAHNATAGAIKVKSFEPDGEFSSTGSFTWGKYNLLELEGAVGFPLIGDMLSGRTSFVANFRDGTTENLCAGLTNEPKDARRRQRCFTPTAKEVREVYSGLQRWQNNVKNWAARQLLLLRPTDDMDWLFNAHWAQNRSDSAHLQMLGTSPLNEHQNTGTGTNSAGWSEYIFQGLDDPKDDDPFTGFYDSDGKEDLDVLGFSLRGTWDLDSVRIVSITGYEQNERTVDDEGDACPCTVLKALWHDETWQASQDLRLEGEGERYSWTAGAYFLTETLEAFNVFDEPSFIWSQEFDQSLWTFSPSVHARYDIINIDDEIPGMEGLSLEGGLRYSWERKRFSLLADVRGRSTGLSTGTFTKRTVGAVWTGVTGDLTLSYTPVESMTTYLKYTRGMKGGHFNSSVTITEGNIEPVAPEFIHSVEIGAKGRWFDGRLQVNASAFRYWYKDLQVFDIVNDEHQHLPTQQLLNSGRGRHGRRAGASRPRPLVRPVRCVVGRVPGRPLPAIRRRLARLRVPRLPVVSKRATAAGGGGRNGLDGTRSTTAGTP